jgi:hypothetical protein
MRISRNRWTKPSSIFRQTDIQGCEHLSKTAPRVFLGIHVLVQNVEPCYRVGPHVCLSQTWRALGYFLAQFVSWSPHHTIKWSGWTVAWDEPTSHASSGLAACFGPINGLLVGPVVTLVGFVSVSTATPLHAATSAYLSRALAPPSCPLTVMFVLHDSSGSKKRRRPPSEEPAPAAKKQKAATEGGRGCGHRPPRFWDTLSKIRLSRGAVREFDRRTSETRQRQRLSAPSTIPTLPARHRPLQRFSRHGGPDLAHLRGVSFF